MDSCWKLSKRGHDRVDEGVHPREGGPELGPVGLLHPDHVPLLPAPATGEVQLAALERERDVSGQGQGRCHLVQQGRGAGVGEGGGGPGGAGQAHGEPPFHDQVGDLKA